MVKENTFIMMEVIIMGIGLKVKCKDKENYMIVMEIFSMKGNGEMIIIREKEYCMV